MTGIEYCDETWNVTAGCTKCAPGCENCWAEKWAYRLAAMGQPYYDLVQEEGCWNGNIELIKEKLNQPLHWRKPRRIFVCSMSDLFHPKVPFEFIDKVFITMALCPQHTFLIFTKRIKRMAEYFDGKKRATGSIIMTESGLRGRKYSPESQWPLPNVQLILSLSTQAEADKKIPILQQIPAAVRGLSLEPLLEYIKIPERYLKDLRWIIVGGESDKGARPMHPDWARSIRDQCFAAGVPFYFKQWGKWGIYGPNKHFDVLHWRTKKITDAYKKLYKTDCCSEGCTDGSMPTTGPVELIKRNIKVECITLKGEIDSGDLGMPYGSVEMGIIGKKKAGCLLDGKEWKQYP